METNIPMPVIAALRLDNIGERALLEWLIDTMIHVELQRPYLISRFTDSCAFK